MKKPNVYLDHAATTYLIPEVLEAMLPYFSEIYGNPESLHNEGKKSLIALDKARSDIANVLTCRASEIIFTGSATEANNLTILGVARANTHKGKHIITSSIEHPSILEPCKQLASEGWEISYLKVDKDGLINPKDLQESIRPNTVLVSIMHANNEIGTIQDISTLGKICKKHQILFHSDACQTACSQVLNVIDLNVDLLTINGSKIYGPKGVAVLYNRRGVKIAPILYGGNQENNLRPGTHNLPAIVGMAKALEIAQQRKEKENKRLTKLRDKLIEGILEIEGSQLNGHPTQKLANNVNVSISGISGQNLLLQLDEAGIYVSTGSACKMGSEEASTVLQAIGLTPNLAKSSLRLSLGLKTTEKEIDYTIKTLSEIIKKIRKNRFKKA